VLGGGGAKRGALAGMSDGRVGGMGARGCGEGCEGVEVEEREAISYAVGRANETSVSTSAYAGERWRVGAGRGIATVTVCGGGAGGGEG